MLDQAAVYKSINDDLNVPFRPLLKYPNGIPKKDSCYVPLSRKELIPIDGVNPQIAQPLEESKDSAFKQEINHVMKKYGKSAYDLLALYIKK